jgi:hypothetical protein
VHHAPRIPWRCAKPSQSANDEVPLRIGERLKSRKHVGHVSRGTATSYFTNANDNQSISVHHAGVSVEHPAIPSKLSTLVDAP